MSTVHLPNSSLWDRESLRLQSVAHWQAIVDDLFATVAVLLGAEIRREPVQDNHDGDFASVGFSAKLPAPATLDLTVAGILTVSTQASARTSITKVSLVGFLFSGDRRLVQTNSEGDLFTAEFVHDGKNAAEWTPLQWSVDGYGEWEGCVTPESVFG